MLRRIVHRCTQCTAQNAPSFTLQRPPTHCNFSTEVQRSEPSGGRSERKRAPLEVHGAGKELRRFDNSSIGSPALPQARSFLKARSPVEVAQIKLLNKLKVLNKTGEWQEALQLLGAALDRQLPMAVSILNTALSVLARTGRWSEAMGVLQEMSQHGVEPNDMSFSYVVHACTKAGKTKLAAEVTEHMQSQNLQLREPRNTELRDATQQVRLSHSLTTALQQTPKHIAVLLLLPLFASLQLQKDTVRQIRQLGQQGNWQAALAMSNNTAAAVQNTFIMNATITALGHNRQWQEAERLLSLMHSAVKSNPASQIVPNMVTYNSVIQAYTKGGQLNSALRLLKQLQQRLEKQQQQQQQQQQPPQQPQQQSPVPDAYTYCPIIAACAQSDRLEEALALLEAMKAAALQPTNVTYNVLISACGRAGQHSQALALFHELEQCQYAAPDVITYTALMDALGAAQQWQVATAVLRYMASHLDMSALRQYDRVSPHAALMRLMQHDGAIDEADELYSSMVNSGLIQHWSTDSAMLDLHQYTLPLALAAVRLVLRDMVQLALQQADTTTATTVSGSSDASETAHIVQQQQQSRQQDVSTDLIIISGKMLVDKQLRRVLTKAPTLRDEQRLYDTRSSVQLGVQQWLHRIGLETFIAPGNTGRLMVRASQLQKLVYRAQQQQDLFAQALQPAVQQQQ
jgi:pentatricopeptide repeat protein